MTTVAEQERTAEHVQAVAELLARRGDARAAEEKLRDALTLDASRASLHADLSSALMTRVSGENVDQNGKLTDDEQKPLVREALSELREAARLDSSLPGIFTRMGAIYEVLGQPEDARIAYEGAIERDTQDATAHYALGSLLLSRQEDAAALPHFEAAVQLEPLAVSFRLALAANYVAMNRAREATRELDLIDRLQPNLPQVQELREILARQQHQKK
jgi:Tfp pilus assembly protein PilF